LNFDTERILLRTLSEQKILPCPLKPISEEVQNKRIFESIVGKIAKKQSEGVRFLLNTILQTAFSAILPTGTTDFHFPFLAILTDVGAKKKFR